ncbi:MAG: 23S rRNA (cytosine(2499)-C(5))-methyltransferase, partial [Limisphaerales bacterium]
DLIILDPPSLAKRESERARAIRAYQQLATTGLALLSAGGILVACSCSTHVSADEFFEAAREAVNRTGLPFRVLETTLQPADHPATFWEANYLKAIYLELKTAC